MGLSSPSHVVNIHLGSVYLSHVLLLGIPAVSFPEPGFYAVLLKLLKGVIALPITLLRLSVTHGITTILAPESRISYAATLNP